MRKSLQPGDHAKLVFDQGEGGERMWVRITSVNDGKYRGVLANNPVLVDLRLGRRVTFEPRHVVGALRKEDA